MALFTIADLHLSLGTSKPMDVFKGWQNYVERIEANWRSRIKPEDTVVLGGDISWAMQLEETLPDFSFLQGLPGQKIILKGNHDYWWTTMAKMNAFLAKNGLTTLRFLFNNSYPLEGAWLCGTRSWLFDPGQAHDAKIIQRETGRLRASLQAAGQGEKIVFLHYPPVYTGAEAPEVIQAMKDFGVKRCYYGHLHGASIGRAVQGVVDGIRYKLVSADSLEFDPVPVPLNEEIVW